jgi:pimeloyl-ACP methyl ester carboxylesterase
MIPIPSILLRLAARQLSASLLAPAPATAPAPAIARTPAQMEHASIQSVGAGPPVVLIPGLASPREVYAGITAQLARGRRVLLVQLNGFAGDPARGNAKGPILDGVVADIAAYLRRERLRPAAVIGHSMGGLIGMRLARDHAPLVDRLMIVDALPFIGTMLVPGATVETIRPAAESMRQAYVAAAARPREPSADDPMLATMSITPQGGGKSPPGGSPPIPGRGKRALRGDAGGFAAGPGQDCAGADHLLYAVPPQIAERAREMWTGAYAAAPRCGWSGGGQPPFHHAGPARALRPRSGGFPGAVIRRRAGPAPARSACGCCRCRRAR